MRRSFSILIWILLGALAASFGIGSVLLDAKHDRILLENQINAQNQHILQLQEEHTVLVEEANRAVAAATRNASATRDILNALVTEQTKLDQAKSLVSSPLSNRWLETISFPLGISLRTPLMTRTTSTDASIESVLTSSGETWMSIAPADQARFDSLTNSILNPQQIQYRVGNTLLTGVRGELTDHRTVFVLQSYYHAKPGFLIWTKVIGSVTENTLLDSLASLRFADTR